MKTGMVVWLTGLSGAGKTTLSRVLGEKLAYSGMRIELLDGDEIRENLSKGLGFSREDRETNVRRIGFVARLLARNGVVVLASAISPYRQSRDDVRFLVESEGIKFLEVFVTCPLETLVERDVKGLYRRAIAGELPNFTGISDPYEPPVNPDCVVDSGSQSVEESIRRILVLLERHRNLAVEASVAQANSASPLLDCQAISEWQVEG